MNEPRLLSIPLTAIMPSKTNNIQRDEWEMKPEALQELAASIKQKGVLSPVLLRPDGEPDKYYLVCGERRFQASKLAGIKEIPAYIRTMSDEEAFDAQITENLQRKDVHPLKEAQAYKALLDADNEKNSISELSKRFGKPVEYIAHRLAFNNLIPEMKKEFFEGKMMIGHAILFSRMTEQDQKICFKQCKPQFGTATDQYEPVRYVQTWISQKLVRELGKACFNINDASLVVNAGSCDTCPTRSGTGQLFNDVKEKDRCFNGACFELKTSRYMVLRIDELLIDDPSILMISDYHASVDNAVKKHLEKNKISILKEYTDFQISQKSEKGSVRGLYVNGSKIGQVAYVKLKSASTAKASTTPEKKKPEDQIAALKESLKRSEMDARIKVGKQVAERLFDLKPYKDGDTTPLSKYEMALILKLVDDEAYSDLQNKGLKAIEKMKPKDIKPNSPGYELEQFALFTPTIFNQFLRGWIKHSLEDGIDGPDDAYTICKIAQSFKGINIKQIEQQVMADHQKLVETTNTKIAAIRAAAKVPAPVKKVVKK